LGDVTKALEYCQESLALKRTLGLREDQASSLHNLSLIWFRLGEYQQALDSDKEALSLSRAAGNRQFQVVTSTRLARVRASDLNKEPSVALKSEIAALIAEYSEIQTRIRLTSPRYASLTAPEPLTAVFTCVRPLRAPDIGLWDKMVSCPRSNGTRYHLVPQLLVVACT
jgi:tetratricopeptide (TPR) repeat protein